MPLQNGQPQWLNQNGSFFFTPINTCLFTLYIPRYFIFMLLQAASLLIQLFLRILLLMVALEGDFESKGV
jgi:hypothetical protein